MQRKTREIVTGRYLDPSTYVLYLEDGSVFQVIREGEPFRIDNQMRPWIPVRIPNKSGQGTIMMCQKFRDNGELLRQFPLFHGKKGLWALTSGAARKGVFHKYTEPKGELEKLLTRLGKNPRMIERAKKIDVDVEVVGFYSNGQGYQVYTDGKEEVLERRGDTYMAHYSDASYLIYTHLYTSTWGEKQEYILRIILTKRADEAKILEILRKIEK